MAKREIAAITADIGARHAAYVEFMRDQLAALQRNIADMEAANAFTALVPARRLVLALAKEIATAELSARNRAAFDRMGIE